MSPLLLRLLLAALLQLALTQAPVSQFDGPSHQKKVVSWIDVYARATCQPREVVVPLSMELVGSVVRQLVPSCVTVQRCGGCCPDDGLECVPTGQHQVRMQILMIQYPSSQLGEMSLEEHSQCECRPKKKESAVKPDSPRTLCPRCTQRRQCPDPRTCSCRCRRRSFLRCQGRGLEFNPDTCSDPISKDKSVGSGERHFRVAATPAEDPSTDQEPSWLKAAPPAAAASSSRCRKPRK